MRCGAVGSRQQMLDRRTDVVGGQRWDDRRESGATFGWIASTNKKKPPNYEKERSIGAVATCGGVPPPAAPPSRSLTQRERGVWGGMVTLIELDLSNMGLPPYGRLATAAGRWCVCSQKLWVSSPWIPFLCPRRRPCSGSARRARRVRYNAGINLRACVGLSV